MSAFDHILEPAIPGKGALLTQLSLWWFARLGMPNHLAAAHPSLGEHLPPGIAERSMLVHELDMFPLECVVRGYLAGSGWAEYQASRNRVRHPAARRACRTATACPSRSTPRRPRRRSASTTRTSRSSRPSSIVGAEDAAALRDAALQAFTTASGDGRAARRDPRRHEVRVRTRPADRRADAGRRGAHQRLAAATGTPRRMPRAASTGSTASTSRSCATGSPRTGTRPARRPSCPPRSSSRRPTATAS